MNTLTLAIIGHLIGDYLLQNDSMASLKKKHSDVCAVHCAIWTLCVITLAGWATVPAVLFLFGTHFLIDRWQFVTWWMKFNCQEKFAGPPFAPWSLIVVDNVWHLVTIFLTGWLLVE